MIAPVERTYWRRLGGTAALKDPPEYGADLPGLSVFGRTPLSASLAGSWDMNRLPCVLSTGLGPEADLPGVTTPMLYIGVWRALFGWHTEDMVRPMIAPLPPPPHHAHMQWRGGRLHSNGSPLSRPGMVAGAQLDQLSAQRSAQALVLRPAGACLDFGTAHLCRPCAIPAARPVLTGAGL